MAAPGHLGSMGQKPQAVSGHRGRATVLCQGTGHRLGTEGLELSNAVMEAAAPHVPLDVLFHFVFRFLREASFFHTKMMRSSQRLGLDSEGKTGEVVQFVNKTLNRREGESFKKL